MLGARLRGILLSIAVAGNLLTSLVSPPSATAAQELVSEAAEDGDVDVAALVSNY